MDKTRIELLQKKHAENFGSQAEAVFSASGRTELGGNHTDHNLGCVIAASINLDTMAAARKTSNLEVSIFSDGYSPILIDISDLTPKKEELNTTNSLVRGIAASIVKRGGTIGGFTACVDSKVPAGSGLSSSAAVEILIGTIFNNFYNKDRFTTTELAIIGQEAENLYFGKPSGLMDQLACAYGGVIGIDFKDPASPIITPVNTDFKSFGYDLVIVNTGGSHADLTKEYSSIPKEMKAVANEFKQETMRFVDYNDFIGTLSSLRTNLSNDRAILRAYHFIKENERAQKMIQALQKDDFNSYLSLVSESGNSSFKYLQNIYNPQNLNEQGISIALALTEDFLNNKGACRIQGGGFAGTIQAYIPEDKTEAYYMCMEKVFGGNCCTNLTIRNTPAGRII